MKVQKPKSNKDFIITEKFIGLFLIHPNFITHRCEYSNCSTPITVLKSFGMLIGHSFNEVMSKCYIGDMLLEKFLSIEMSKTFINNIQEIYYNKIDKTYTIQLSDKIIKCDEEFNPLYYSFGEILDIYVKFVYENGKISTVTFYNKDDVISVESYIYDEYTGFIDEIRYVDYSIENKSFFCKFDSNGMFKFSVDNTLDIPAINMVSFGSDNLVTLYDGVSVYTFYYENGVEHLKCKFLDVITHLDYYNSTSRYYLERSISIIGDYAIIEITKTDKFYIIDYIFYKNTMVNHEICPFFIDTKSSLMFTYDQIKHSKYDNNDRIIKISIDRDREYYEINYINDNTDIVSNIYYHNCGHIAILYSNTMDNIL